MSHTPTTPERLAAHPEVIAVFVFSCDPSTVPLPIIMHGSHARQWLGVADSFARACVDALADDRVTMHIGDAQVLRYLRRGQRAIVVVTPFVTHAIGKSIWRTMKVALNHFEAEIAGRAAAFDALRRVAEHVDNPSRHARAKGTAA